MVAPILLNNKPSLSSSHSDLPGDKGAVGKFLGPRGPFSPCWPVASRWKGGVLHTLQDLKCLWYSTTGMPRPRVIAQQLSKELCCRERSRSGSENQSGLPVFMTESKTETREVRCPAEMVTNTLPLATTVVS